MAIPVLPNDPNDAAAVLRALGRACQWRLGRALGAGWRVRRLLPRADGRLELTLEHGGETCVVLWQEPPAPDERVEPAERWHRGLLRPGRPGAPVDRATLRALTAAVAEALEHPGYRLLRWCNRDLFELRYDHGVVDRLLADRFSLGETRWHDYVFVEAFQRAAEQFELSFSGPGGALRFAVVSPAVDSPGELITDHPLFRLFVVEDPRAVADRSNLSAQVERLVSFLLCRAVHPAMALAVSGPRVVRQGPDGAIAPEDPWRDAPVSTSRWGNPVQWRQFFSDFEIARSNLCGVRFTEPVAHISHGERECHLVEPQVRPRPITHAHVPWPAEPPARPLTSREYVPRIGERETVLGGGPLLAGALRQALENPHVHLISVNNTCLPKMIGDDVASLVKRARGETALPVLSMNTDLGSPEETFGDLVAQWCAAVPPASGGAERAVSLFGYWTGRATRELQDTLAQLGIEVAALLVPSLGREVVRRYRRGRAQVVYPWRSWVELHDRIFGALELPVLDAPAPYGVEDTRRWLSVISAAFGRQDALEAWWTEQASPVVAELERLRAVAGAHRLAVVVDVADAPRLIEAELLYGVRLLPLLTELGFGVDVLLHVPAGPAAERATDEAAQPLWGAVAPDAHLGLHVFSTETELEQLLADGPFAAVYTELACDERITRAGKTPFHLSMIEMGLGGALRSLRRLLRVCEWPFHRRYRPHLSRPRSPRKESDGTP